MVSKRSDDDDDDFTIDNASTTCCFKYCRQRQQLANGPDPIILASNIDLFRKQ